MRHKSELGWAASIIAVLVFTIWLIFYTRSSHETQVRTWAEEHGYSVVSMERVGLWNDSPFWRSKGDDMIRAKLRDREFHERTSFFRWRIFGMDQAWKE